jgi:hypothetical protein
MFWVRATELLGFCDIVASLHLSTSYSLVVFHIVEVSKPHDFREV